MLIKGDRIKDKASLVKKPGETSKYPKAASVEKISPAS
jgi:hypothetical protein